MNRILFSLASSLFCSAAAVNLAGAALPDTAAIRIVDEVALPEFPKLAPEAYTHFIDYQIYLTRSESPGSVKLQRLLGRAQQALDHCGIELRASKAALLQVPEWLLDWEGIDFNGGSPSEHERQFFSRTPARTTGALFIDFVNWSYDADATVALGYAPFIAEKEDMLPNPEDRAFYLQKMAGHSILSRFATDWTLVHEIGHSVFDLQHVEDDPENVMFPRRKVFARFSEEQCSAARARVNPR